MLKDAFLCGTLVAHLKDPAKCYSRFFRALFSIARRVQAVPALRVRMELATNLHHFLMESPETEKIRDDYKKARRQFLQQALAKRAKKKARRPALQNTLQQPSM